MYTHTHTHTSLDSDKDCDLLYETPYCRQGGRPMTNKTTADYNQNLDLSHRGAERQDGLLNRQL